MQNPAVGSEKPYFDSIILISHHIHNQSGLFENPITYFYQGITCSTMEYGILGLFASISDVLLVIYCYQLLILVKNIFHSPFSRHHCPISCVVINILLYCTIQQLDPGWIVWYKRNFTCNGRFLTYMCIPNPRQKCHNNSHPGWDYVERLNTIDYNLVSQ